MALHRLPGEARPFVLSDLQNPGEGPLTAISGAVVTLSLQDAAGTTVAGPTVATATDDDWSAILTAPTTTGRYALVASVLYGGETFEMDPQTVLVGPTLGIRGTTRRDLRRRIGDELGGIDVLVATRATTTAPYTVIYDDQRLIGGDNHYRARLAYIARGASANVGATRFVTGSDYGARSITLDPALPAAVAIGDEVELWGRRGGKGFEPERVHRVINAVIGDAADRGGVPISATLTAAFDSDSPTLTLPNVFEFVHEVQYRRTTDLPEWTSILRAGSATSGGWWAPGFEGVLAISGGYRTAANDASIRVFGTGRPDALTDDDERTEVNARWIVARACAELLRGALASDPLYERKIGLYQKESDQRELESTPLLPVGSVPVRG